MSHSFDPCDCIVFRLYAKLLCTHAPNLAYCAIFLNELVMLHIKHSIGKMLSLRLELDVLSRVAPYCIILSNYYCVST